MWWLIVALILIIVVGVVLWHFAFVAESPSPSSTPSKDVVYDYIIVGGGIAGTRMYNQLIQRGFTVLLMERDRIGGRLLTRAVTAKPATGDPIPSSGELIEYGAMRYFPETQHLSAKLVGNNRCIPYKIIDSNVLYDGVAHSTFYLPESGMLASEVPERLTELLREEVGDLENERLWMYRYGQGKTTRGLLSRLLSPRDVDAYLTSTGYGDLFADTVNAGVYIHDSSNLLGYDMCFVKGGWQSIALEQVRDRRGVLEHTAASKIIGVPTATIGSRGGIQYQVSTNKDMNITTQPYKGRNLVLALTPIQINQIYLRNVEIPPLDGLITIPLFKMFIYFQQPWWGDVHAKHTGDGLIKQLYQYNANTLLIYNAGAAGTTLNDRLTNTTDADPQVSLELTIRQLLWEINLMTRNPQPQDLERQATQISYDHKYWEDGTVDVDLNADGQAVLLGISKHNRTPGTVKLVSDSYSPEPGWVDGALMTVEDALAGVPLRA
ncbi:Hypothetical protein POVN_LOCUS127 [uncultured virus]|nr:Hypothetical protein POVN_LOCUS127 [uncultured virus]